MLQITSYSDLLTYLHSHPTECCVLLLLLFAFTHQVYFYLRYIRKGGQTTCSNPKQQQATATPSPTEKPGVSVIVCARNEEKNLQDYLHTLLNQSYPTYEVIVVNDGSYDNTEMILELYARQYKHLYRTFVPQGVRVISSKKLALTIGIKAARYDYILLTDADCRPESKFWISEMMAGFNNNTEIVIGFSPYFQKKGLLNKLLRYDTFFSGLQFMGMAKAGQPYMGVGRNLAYRKQTFFDHHGFRGILNHRAGDDDLFVNKVAKKRNTSVVCNCNSLVWSVPKTTWRAWVHQKRRHLSVSPQYRLLSKLRIGLEPITRGLMHGLLIVGILIKGYLGYCAIGLWILRLILQLSVINSAAKKLQVGTFGLGIIAYDIMLPLITLSILVSQSMRKRQLYW